MYNQRIAKVLVAERRIWCSGEAHSHPQLLNMKGCAPTVKSPISYSGKIEESCVPKDNVARTECSKLEPGRIFNLRNPAGCEGGLRLDVQ